MPAGPALAGGPGNPSPSLETAGGGVCARGGKRQLEQEPAHIFHSEVLAGQGGADGAHPQGQCVAAQKTVYGKTSRSLSGRAGVAWGSELPIQSLTKSPWPGTKEQCPFLHVP